MKNTKNTRKVAVGIVAALAVTGLVGASAASLGSISTEGLGAAADDVTSCDSDGVAVAYETAWAGSSTVEVETVTISDVAAACDTLDYEVLLVDGGDAVIGEVSGTVTLDDLLDLTDAVDDFDVDFSSENVDAEEVEGIAITITGNDNGV